MTFRFFETMPRIIGHRGAKGLAPENTLASFKAAADTGTKSVEIDVTATKDDKLVIHHDMSLKRCTNGEGLVLLENLDDLRELDAGSWFSSDFAGEKIPTLEEALISIHEQGMSLNLEIKPTDGWQIPTTVLVADGLRSTSAQDLPILISSFNEDCLTVAKDLLPEYPRGYLTDAIPPDWERRMNVTGSSSFHLYHPFVTKESVRDIQSAGYKFLVYTVNDVDDAKRFLDWGVDAIITDFPDRMLAL